MRRHVVLACVAALVFLTACDSPANNSSRASPSDLTASAAAEQTAEAGAAEQASESVATDHVSEADAVVHSDASEPNDHEDEADDDLTTVIMPPSPGQSFDGKTLVTEHYTIVITDYEVIQPGETGNRIGSRPIVAFWYDLTAHEGSKGVAPTAAWSLSFAAAQGVGPSPKS